jgi:putative tricarboxylic transport membrane protein
MNMGVIGKWVGPIGVIAGSLYLWYLTLGFKTMYAQSETFGPAFFPRFILGGLVLVSVLQLIRLAAARARTAAGEASDPLHWPDLLALLGLSLGYVVLMKTTGFLPATFLFQGAVLSIIFRQRNLKLLLGVPAVLTAIYFFIFVRVLQMPLPQGYGWFREFSRLVYF